MQRTDKLDVRPEARQWLLARLREMTPEQRIRQTFAMIAWHKAFERRTRDRG